MVGRIVAGVNGSPADERTVRWAAERASALGESLELVHVIDGVIGAGGSGSFLIQAQSAASEFLGNGERLAREIDPELDVVQTIEQGDPFRIIGTKARDADALVVGSDWTGGERASTRGTRSLKFAAVADVPVVVVPDIDVHERAAVVVGVDGSEQAQRALAFAAGEAVRLGVPLHAVHAWVVPLLSDANYGFEFTYQPEYAADLEEGATAELDTALEGVLERHPGLDLRKLVVQEDAVTALVEAAREASLVVVGSHGRGAFARLFLGSVSHGVLTNLVSPVAVIR
ncbi:universal stress protein [Agromyces seonyuensis]|uniref:Universal stress protein n=1 Tax=Agromyces seonyuensis TaxID=2662446 RepID=A0A6I4NTQ7_9MICO|nr:universal stress protein [Agromyces seonyuensis]MWB97491.1 universal stress protein [Agromyces seonyuensis]